jgi:hypothetical protein
MPRAVPDGHNPRPAGLGVAGRPATEARRVHLHVEVTSTILPAYKASYAARTDLEEL